MKLSSEGLNDSRKINSKNTWNNMDSWY